MSATAASAAQVEATPIVQTETVASPLAVEATAIVKYYTKWSAGIGIIPIPIVDLIAVLGVQLKMIGRISNVYGVAFSEHTVKNIIAALIGTGGGGIVFGAVGSSLFKFIPGAGGLISAWVCSPIIAGASTYALGKVFIAHFEAGGTLLDFDPEKMRAYYRSQFTEGQKVAAEARKQK